MEFGRLMRRAREEKRMSLAVVGEALDFTPVHLSEIERGRRNPPKSDRVRDWAQLLEIDVDYALKSAAESVEIVKLPVNRNPQYAEVALAFLREMDGNRLTDEKRESILAILNKDE